MSCKTFIQNLLLVLGSLIFAAGLAEILLRVLLPSPIVWMYPQESYLYDPEIGHRLKPIHKAFTHDKIVNINSQGIRDNEYSSKAGTQVTRILAIGDSQTFGNGIEQEDTWPKQLERDLNGRAGTGGYEVLNGGLPGSDTWQHEILMQRLISIYNPEFVVLAFYVNDIVSKPASIINAQGDDRGASFSRRLVYLLKQSALLLSLKTSYETLWQALSPRAGFQLQKALLAGESNPEIDSRWEQVEQSLKAMKRITARKNIGFLVVSLPRRDQVDGSLPAEKYNEQLSVVIRKSGVPFINVLEPLQQSYQEYGKALFIPWDGHNTALANRVIAGEVAAVIPGIMAGRSE